MTGMDENGFILVENRYNEIECGVKILTQNDTY